MKAVICIFAFALALFVFGSPYSVRAQTQNGSPVNDQEIRVVDFKELIYSPLARNAQIQGVVVIRVKLDDQGKVTEAVAISGPEIFYLDCLSNVKNWRFKPNPKKTAVVIYDFKILEGRCNSDSSLFVLQGSNIATILVCPPRVNTSSSK